jgi:hypothetical protein
VADFITKFDLASEAVRSFQDAVDQALISVEALHAGIDDLPAEHLTNVSLAGEDEILEQVAEIREYLAALPDRKLIVADMVTATEGNAGGAAAAAGAVGALDDAEANLARDAVEAAAAQGRLNDALNSTTRDAAAATVATGAAGAAAGGAAGGWGLLGHNLQTFGGAAEMALGRQVPLVTSIAGWHLLLDGAAEGMIAVSGALIALGAAAAGMAPSFLDIYNNLKSTRDQVEAFGVEIKPFNSWFLNLQHAMQTQSIELFGEALLDMGKANTSVAGDIENVGQAIDRMGAKISEWISKNADFGETIKKGGEYAKDLGDILGNLIVIVDELIRADSGIVNFVLDFFVGFTHAAAAVLGFSETLDRFLLLGHGFLLWGGLLSSMLINMALLFLRPVANILAFAGGVQGATAAIRDFEVANDAAATPVQKIGIVFGTMGTAIGNIAGNIKTWAVGIGEDMSAAEGTVATAAAGMKAALAPLGDALVGLLASPAAILAAAAALGYAAYEGMQATSSAKSFAAALQQTVSNDNASQAIIDISNSIGQLNQQISQTSAGSMEKVNQQVQSWGPHFQATAYAIDAAGAAFGKAFAAVPESLATWGNAKKTVDDFGTAFKDLFTGSGAASQAATQNINLYKQSISGLTGDQQTLFKVAGTTMKENSVGFAQALGLMDAAGIKSGESFGEDMTQVEGLIKGYEALGEKGGDLNNSINAVTLSTEIQESQISSITGAWTTFINLVTGGESSFVTVAQQVQGALSAAGGAAASLSISNGKVSDSIKTATTSAHGAIVNIDALSTAGLSLKSTFIQTVQSMSGSINSLLQLSSAGGQGAKGIREVDQAGKDYVASLLPLAKGSQDATAMLYALAQQAGYTGADSFASLAQWVGNIKDPMQQAETITQRLTIAAGNLSTDVTNLANAINTNLASAMATAISGGSKMQTALDNMYTALHKNSDIMDNQVKQAAKNLAVSLLDDLGGNVDAAKQKFEAFYIMMGYTKGEADKMWASVVRLAQAIDGLHSKSISVNVAEYVTSSGRTATSLLNPGGHAAGTPSASPGWSWVGEAGPELVNFRGGETVIPNHATKGYAEGAGWYDSGGYFPGLTPVAVPAGASGMVSGASGGAAQPLHVHVNLDGREMATAIVPDLVGAVGRYGTRNAGRTTGLLKPS